ESAAGLEGYRYPTALIHQCLCRGYLYHAERRWCADVDCRDCAQKFQICDDVVVVDRRGEEAIVTVRGRAVHVDARVPSDDPDCLPSLVNTSFRLDIPVGLAIPVSTLVPTSETLPLSLSDGA